MGVTAPNGNGFKNTTAAFAAVGAKFAEAQDRILCSQVTVTNGDDANAVYHLGWIRSAAIIDPSSFAAVQAIAGLTNVSIGISGSGGQAVAAGSANCLVNAADWHLGSLSQSLTSAITAANAQKAAWQLAGLAVDPGGNLEVYATLGNAPTATGVFTTFLRTLSS